MPVMDTTEASGLVDVLPYRPTYANVDAWQCHRSAYPAAETSPWPIRANFARPPKKITRHYRL
jgi:hypothetical protein